MTHQTPKGRIASSTLRKTVSVSAVATALLLSAAAQAQEASPGAEEPTTVIVTGYRASLQSALTTKRKADVMMDAINAEDIADFPDANLAESLQRIPGISIDRDNGEGRTITVRGLGADFTRVRINGLEALSTAGANDAGSNPNRSRAFDFNTFASELFNSLRVRKSSSAETDEGSLGATVDLITGRPFDYKKDQYAFSIQDAYYDNGGFHNPRVTGLISKRWADGKLGFLASVAYSERDSENDQYRRGIGQSEYLYRNATWLTNEIPMRAGFSAPAGTTFPATSLPNGGLCPGTTTPVRPAGFTCPLPISNTNYANAVTGSDQTAYDLLHNPLNASLVRIPALGSIEQQDLHQERLGITASFQMQPNPNTRVSIDGLYSKFRNESTIYQVSSVGLNRDNTNAGYGTAVNDAARAATSNTGTNPGTALSLANRRALYPGTCTQQDATDVRAAIDCGQTLNGTTLVSGTAFSYNPNNLDPYDYYNAEFVNGTRNPGYVASADLLGFRDRLIGRQATDVLAANVSNGVADYLVLRNVDWRSGADRNFYTTEFKQLSFNLNQKFTDRLTGDFTLGASESYNENQGLLVEFNRMDSPESFVFDERGGGEMPVFNLGFNAADPANWGMVKGFSAIRHFQRFVTNKYAGAKADFGYELNENLSLKFGVTSRKYDFQTNLLERENDLLNPTEKEAKVSVASLGRVVQFGQGLDVPGGTTTSFFAPSIEGFNSVFDFTCNCINKWGDWRIHGKRNGGRENFKVQERSEGGYLQLNFDYDVLGGNVFGNIGVRQVKTDLTSYGNTSGGRPITGRNEYTDTLPAFNVAWQVVPNVYLRAAAAKVMARPLLGNLSPSITAISIPTTGGTTGATLTIGNPKLQPFRGKTYDLSAEWYFAKGGLLSMAVFKKDIASYPQTVLFSAPLSNFLSAEDLATLKLQFNTGSVADNARLAYIDANGEATARQFRDAPGGTLEGWEFSYQQDFTFLPWILKNTGVQFNMTHIDSKLTYILDPGTATVAPTFGNGPWLGASPDAINLTLYYEADMFSARVSMAKREGYYTTYPLAAGSCSPGLNITDGTPCNSPLINDFAGSLPTQNVDFSMSYKPTKRLTITLEGLNMTNETTNRFGYGATSQTVVSQYGSTGRQLTLGVRYKY